MVAEHIGGEFVLVSLRRRCNPELGPDEYVMPARYSGSTRAELMRCAAREPPSAAPQNSRQPGSIASDIVLVLPSSRRRRRETGLRARWVVLRHPGRRAPTSDDQPSVPAARAAGRARDRRGRQGKGSGRERVLDRQRLDLDQPWQQSLLLRDRTRGSAGSRRVPATFESVWAQFAALIAALPATASGDAPAPSASFK